MQNLIKNFVNDESGATAIEYGLIAALIAVAMIAGATALGESINDKFADVSAEMDKVKDTKGKKIKGGD
ncbi:Flp family type IVb pilin [Algimonas porphyrae]|uniref:Fimbrial protein n=1 Tax=Algimonas porphyrae TaxID=1128113 RepID=A0ABQ5UXR8_9PROT|nr:Flp family type IVb pilin [Algimonas porphyrae]GLQ19948.1 fimbrial protein [Algimonas porphyrae]